MKKGDSVAVCWGWLHASCCGGGGPRLLHRQALQCGCMAHRQPRSASAPPKVIGTTGRNSRDCPLEPSTPRRGSAGGAEASNCRGVEERRRPQWTPDSWLAEVLLEGKERITNMWLSDFLWNCVGGRAAVDEGYNVTMEVFVQEPDDCVQDQRLLEEILNLTAHQALEAITKPLHKGVFSLGQRSGYERKTYDHSSCKGKTKRSTCAGTDGSKAGGRGKAKTNAGNEIYHFH
ncbi:hypothetical protein ECC02_008932 [Trypanosoma cruzi]|uniref:DUF7578 domain-containing protein n=1 Tax=Trypanosoma cruzi TaxID=5693 RepID=A0A7J6XWA4_TRYCR|nr:hypothetical protein ECC02_008932 [Trypanosoma cruzi]